MKALRTIAIIGNLAMLLGSIFLIINLSIGKEIFPDFVTLPLVMSGIVGSVCTLINTNKRK